MPKYYIGIDPGLSGAIAVSWESGALFFSMPLMKQPWSAKEQNMVDPKALRDILSPYKNEDNIFTIEAVNAMPKQGVSSTWKFAGAFYTAVNVCQLLEINLNFVHPASWKNQFGFTGAGKDAARREFLTIYPDMEKIMTPERGKLTLSQAQGRAEAFFIAISKYKTE